MYIHEKVIEIKNKWDEYLKCNEENIQTRINTAEAERRNFLSYFGSREQIENLSSITYTFFKNHDNNSLCRLIDYGTTSLGESKINNQNGANRYYFQKKEDGTIIVNESRPPISIREGMSDEEMINNIKPYLLDLFDACQINDIEEINRNPLRQILKNKLDFIYRGDRSIPIYVNNHLDKIIDNFGIPLPSNNITTFNKREAIYNFFNYLNLPNSSPIIFMDFLYNKTGYRSLLKPNTKIRLKNGTRSLSNNNDESNELYSFTSWEELKRIGEEGERIVYEYLCDHMDELKIDKDRGIIDTRQGQMRGVHCDFVYYNLSGEEIYIEVKATKLDRPNNYHFMMSRSEYIFMCQNKKNYYIYYINNVFNCDVIERLNYKLIKDLLFTYTYAVDSHKE